MIQKIFIYLVLFVFAIPWYWPEHDQRLLFGLPMWVTFSVIFSTFIAAFTAFLLLSKKWPGEK